MKNTIAKVISDLGAIRIENLVGTEVPTNLIGSYPEDYATATSHFLCPAEKQRSIKDKQGGMRNARKKESTAPRSDRSQ